MFAVHDESGPLDERLRSARLFRGEVIVFRDLAAVRALVRAARAMIRRAFAPHSPLRAHRRLGEAAFARRAEALIGAFETDPDIRALYGAMLAAVGAAPARNDWDRLRLRIQPPEGGYRSRWLRSLPPHRDSWGSNVMAQANWWAPIYAVTAKRTLAIYPACFERPIANDSAGWDFDALRARLKRGDASYPLLPTASAPLAREPAWPVVIAPGDLLCFSGAHLHASVPNTTRLVRYSTEVRTCNRDDLAAGRGAPNVDGEATRISLDWFRNIADGAALGAPGRRGGGPS